MWIPFADAVVVVSNNPTFDGCLGAGQGYEPRHDMDYRLEPFRSLLKDVSGDDGEGLGFAELRDALLAIKPLDLAHVKKINRAEAEFWRRSQGTHVGDSSTEIELSSAAAQQWVNECCFPAVLTRSSASYAIDAVPSAQGSPTCATCCDCSTLLKVRASPPRHPSSSAGRPVLPLSCPRRGRWTEDALFSWVGIIMYCQRRLTPHAVDAPRLHLRPRPSRYLPSDDEHVRTRIGDAFRRYKGGARATSGLFMVPSSTGPRSRATRASRSG